MDEHFATSDTAAPLRFASSATIKWLTGLRVRQLKEEFSKRTQRSGEKVQETNKFRHILATVLSLAASVTGGAIFLLSLVQRFALVEIAASLVTALQVYFLSSAIADLLEKGKRSTDRRNSLVVLFTVFLVAFYFFTQFSMKR